MTHQNCWILLHQYDSILCRTLTPTAIGGNLSATTTRDYNNISTYCYYNHNHHYYWAQGKTYLAGHTCTHYLTWQWPKFNYHNGWLSYFWSKSVCNFTKCDTVLLELLCYWEDIKLNKYFYWFPAMHQNKTSFMLYSFTTITAQNRYCHEETFVPLRCNFDVGRL